MFATGVCSWIGVLVHPSASTARERHARFIATRVAISGVGLAILPFFLAYRGAPSAAETAIFACSLTPLAAALLLARTGQLLLAHIAAYLGTVALSFVLWLGLGYGAGCALAWLVVAQFDLASAGNGRLALVAGCAATALALLVLATVPTPDPGLQPEAGTAFVAFGALLYAVVISASMSAPGRRDTPDLWRHASELTGDILLALDARASVIRIADPARAAEIAPGGLIGARLLDRVHLEDRPILLRIVAEAAEHATTATIRLRTDGGEHEVGRSQTSVYLPMRVRAVRVPPNEILVTLRAVEEKPVDVGLKTNVTGALPQDIRSSLNAVIGFSDILASRTLRPFDAATQVEYARTIARSGRNLMSLVETMTAASLAAAGDTGRPAGFEIAAVKIETVPASSRLPTRVPPEHAAHEATQRMKQSA